MATQNQGNSNVVYRSMAYDNASYITRQSSTALTVSAGASGTSGKFYAWTNLQIYGFTAVVTAVATSTYTANGTATTSASTLSPVLVMNTNTTGTEFKVESEFGMPTALSAAQQCIERMHAALKALA